MLVKFVPPSSFDLIADLDDHYLREHGHPQPHGHDAELARSAGREISASA